MTHRSITWNFITWQQLKIRLCSLQKKIIYKEREEKIDLNGIWKFQVILGNKIKELNFLQYLYNYLENKKLNIYYLGPRVLIEFVILLILGKCYFCNILILYINLMISISIDQS